MHVEDLVRQVISAVTLKTVAVAGFVYLAYVFVTTVYDVFYGPLSYIPGPKLWAASSIPSAYNLWTGNDVAIKSKLHDKYGPVVRVSPIEVSYCDSQAWKDIYGHRTASKKSFLKDPRFYSRSVNGAYSIISSATDEEHARHRRVLTHSFSDKALKEQEPLLKRWAQKLTQKLGEACQDGPVDLVAYYNFTTFDVMADLTFGEDLNMLERSEYVPWVSLIFGSLVVATRIILMKKLPATRFIPPLLGNLLRKIQVEHFNYSADRVNKRIANPPNKPNLWTEVLERGEKVEMTLDEMHANSTIYMTAGSETTATTLSGLTYLLLRHPDVMAKLTHELRTAFQTEENITVETLARLPYLNACLEEGMRMYPPVPVGLPRVAPEGGAAICGKWVPEGTTVYVSQVAAYRSKDHWFEPESFIPERWLGQDDRFKDDNRSCFQPFSTGPRNCIGRNLAYHEARVLLCAVLWNYDLKLMPESAQWMDQRVYLLWQKRPLMVELKPVAR